MIIFGVGAAVDAGVDGVGTGAGVSSGLLQAVSSSTQMNLTTPCMAEHRSWRSKSRFGMGPLESTQL